MAFSGMTLGRLPSIMAEWAFWISCGEVQIVVLDQSMKSLTYGSKTINYDELRGKKLDMDEKSRSKHIESNKKRRP